MNTTGSSSYLRWMPLTVTLCPVVYLYASNLSSVNLNDLLPPLVFMAAFALAVQLLLRRLMSDPDEAVLAASWFVGGLFLHGVVFNILNLAFRATIDDRVLLPYKYATVSWFLIWIAGFVAISRVPWRLTAFNRFVFTMSLVFLGLSSLLAFRKLSTELSRDEVALPTWSAVDFDLTLPESPPDIYFLVFDRYAGRDILSKEYDYDNSKFYNELRARGFEINEESCANYPRTLLSMTSALNCELLPEEAQNDEYYRALLNDHRVGRALTKVGYKYVHLGNAYGPLRTNKNASSDMPPSFLPSEFADILYMMTPLGRIYPLQDKYSFAIERFRRVATADGDGEPVFVYAHFLLPHRPYVFDANGKRLPEREVAKSYSKKNYVGQLQATNRMILETVDAILKKPGSDPIIVLMADEGPYLKKVDQSLDREHRIRYRARILSAMRLPQTEDQLAIPDTISPVNTFRFLFDRYFGTQLGLVKDRTYFWEKEGAEGAPAEDNPRFIDVTEAVQD